MNSLYSLFTQKHGQAFEKLKFQTIILTLVVIGSFYVYFPKTYGFVIILVVFSLYISNAYVATKINAYDDFNSKTLVKLQQVQVVVNKFTQKQYARRNLQQPTFVETKIKPVELDALYIDADMIHFLHSILPLYEYNDSEFVLMIRGINNILKVKLEIETFFNANGTFPSNISETIESVIMIKQNIMNNAHNFIYSVPKTNKMYKYVDSIVIRLRNLLNRNLQELYKMHKKHQQQTGINNKTIHIPFLTTQPFDPVTNHISPNSTKVIPFFS